MSAEGKKKRGNSGRSNAEGSPFRLGGGGCHPKALAQVMAMLPGVVGRIGRPQDGSAFDKATEYFPNRKNRQR